MIHAYWSFPLIAGLCDSIFRIFVGKRKHLEEREQLALAGWTFVLASPFYAFWVIRDGMPHLGDLFWPYIFFHVPFLALGQVCNVKALHGGEVSKVVPYSAFTPVFLLFSFPFTRTPSPQLMGIVGVCTILFGVYIANVPAGSLGNILEPLKTFKSDRGAHFMLLSSLLFAVAISLDKLIIASSSISFFLFVDQTIAGIIILGIANAWPEKNSEQARRSIRFRPLYCIFGFLLFVATYCYITALFTLSTPAYIVAVRRSALILFSFVFGVTILKELDGWRVRLLGTVIVVIGMIVTILSS